MELDQELDLKPNLEPELDLQLGLQLYIVHCPRVQCCFDPNIKTISTTGLHSPMQM